MSGRTIRWVVAGLLAMGLAVSILPFSGTGYQVIEEMEQTINGRQVTVKGRIRWPQNVTIHVYIPTEPQGAGAELEVQAACKAWEAKLRSETNANLSFEYHVGQSAPPMGPDDPPPYVIEVNWTDEETTGEPGTATPVSEVTQSDDGTYQRGDTYRGIININRNQSRGQPYSGNAIYNIALHEFGHIFGLDHKTPEQDSVIMDDRGIDDPNKKHPIKDDDIRGLQDAAIQAVPCHQRKVMRTKRMRNPGNPPARCAVCLSAEESSAARWSTRRLSARATTASSSPGHVKPPARRTRIKGSMDDAMEAWTHLDYVVAPIWEAHST